MIAVEERGVEVDLYALVPQHDDAVQSDAAALVDRVTDRAGLGVPAIIGAQIHWLRHCPRRGGDAGGEPCGATAAHRISPCERCSSSRSPWSSHGESKLMVSTGCMRTGPPASPGRSHHLAAHRHRLQRHRARPRPVRRHVDAVREADAATAIVTISDYNRRLLVESWPWLESVST